MTKQFFGTAQVARSLGLHQDTVRSYVKTGLLACAMTPPGPQGKSQRRYTPQDLLEFMRRHHYGMDAMNHVREQAGLPLEVPPAVGDRIQMQLSTSINMARDGLNQLLLVAGSEVEERQLLDFHRKLQQLINTQNVHQLNHLLRGDTRDIEEKQAAC